MDNNKQPNTNPVPTNNVQQGPVAQGAQNPPAQAQTGMNQQAPVQNVAQSAPAQPVVNQPNKATQPITTNVAPTEQPVANPNNQQQPNPQVVAQPQQQTAPQVQTGPKYSFNSDEKVIYKFKEEKEANPIMALIIIAIFVVIIFFLPTITKKLGNIREFNFNFTSTNNTNTNQQTQDNKDMKYKLNDSLNAAQIGGLSISQLGVGEEYGESFITFTVINKSNESYLFNKKYYVNLYNNDSLLYRALIYSDEINAIGSFASSEIKLPIPSSINNQINQYDVSEIETSKYYSRSVTEEEGEFKVLTCSYQDNVLKYYFLDNHLAKIYETISAESSSNNNYLAKRNDALALVEKYQSLGLNSHMEERDYTFKVINDLDLKEIQNITLKGLNKHRYFEYGESSTVIMFEMLAMAYTCG